MASEVCTEKVVNTSPDIRAIPCPECDGSGEPYDGVQCSECEGTGKVLAEVDPITLHDLGETCRDCCGSGFAGHPDSNVKCARCNGSGETTHKDELLEALQICQRALALLTEAKHTATNDPAVSVVNAWAQCVEAETKARAAITKATAT